MDEVNPKRRWKLRILETIQLPMKSMVDVLRAIDNFAGTNAKWTLSVRRIAEYAHISERQVRRAIRALEEASLLDVTEQKRRRYYGGQGANEYQIIWSNLTELYDQQTGQKRFDFDAADEQTPRCHGVSPPGHDVSAPGHHVSPPGHDVSPPGHDVSPPGHDVSPQYITAPDPAQRTALPPPSSARASDDRPSGGSCRPDAAGSGGREGHFLDGASDQSAAGGGWDEACRELAAYGVRAARRACVLARGNGCTPTYVRQLVAFARSRCIPVPGSPPAGNGHPAPGSPPAGSAVSCWGPGAVWYRVIHARPNEPIADGWPPPAEAYVRAKRDRDRAAELQLQRAAARREQERAAKSREKREAHLERLEAAYGPALDAMTRDEKLALLDGTGLTLAAVEAFGGRLKLLELLAAQEGAASPWATGRDGGPPVAPDGET